MKKKIIRRRDKALESISLMGKKKSKKLLEDIFTAAVSSPEYESLNAHQRAETMRLYSSLNSLLS